MFISINTEKSICKIQQLFMIKRLNKLGVEGNVLNLIKGIYEKPIVNIVLMKNEKFSPKIKNMIRIPLSPILLTSISALDNQRRAIR